MVSIIIVNYNTCKLTSECINSIYEKVHSCKYEIIVVDNASVIILQRDKKKISGGYSYNE